MVKHNESSSTKRDESSKPKRKRLTKEGIQRVKEESSRILASGLVTPNSEDGKLRLRVVK